MVKYSGFAAGDTAASALPQARRTASRTRPCLERARHLFGEFRERDAFVGEVLLRVQDGQAQGGPSRAHGDGRQPNARAAGASNPPLTATITGFTGGESLATSDVAGAPVCTTTAKATSSPGAYTIHCSKGTLASTNYKFTLVAGTLTVT